MKSASFDAPHQATYPALNVVDVTFVCVERFHQMVLSFNITAKPDTDL